MNKYYYALSIGGGCTDGLLVVEANNQYEAYTKAQDSFVYRWIKTFPELDVDYNVDLVEVEINKDEIRRKIDNARMFCPGDEDLELNSDGYEVRVLRYQESRGSALPIDGADEVLWYEDDAGMDENFDPEEFKAMFDYVSGF